MWIFRIFGKVVFGFLNVLKKAKLFVNEINKYVVVPLDHLISDDKEERRHQRTSLPLPVKVMIKRSPALTTQDEVMNVKVSYSRYRYNMSTRG